ncbi:MAG TPA: hypothetical protein VGE76_18005 [Opitutaceae bacterium]
MPSDSDTVVASTNWLRRLVGIFIGFTPLALLTVSLIVGIARDTDVFFDGMGFIGAAALIAGCNTFLSFVRPAIFRRRHGTMDGYRNVSGIPLIGTLLLCVGTLTGFGAVGSAAIGIAAFVLDTGGAGWLVIATWRDGSFWDK